MGSIDDQTISTLRNFKEKSSLLDLPKEKSDKPATDFTKFDKDYTYFHVMDHNEPHAIRRRVILEKHPEMQKLFQREPYTSMLFVILIHIIQTYICYILDKHQWSWFTIISFALVIGAIFNHMLFVLIHDITHFNCFKVTKYNQFAAIFSNLPQIIPSAIAFGRYHRDHHFYLGDPLLDPDIPTVIEIYFFKTPLRRICFIMLLPFFYALRPYMKKPKSISGMEVLNILCCFLYGYLIYYLFTIKGLIYLTISTYFGLSVHPVSAHVIAEHYEFFKSQDTYSYYGWINYINFNMGYHVEHHDFPSIPWYNLPKVRKIAPEYYDNLPQIYSYVTVIFKYIFDGSIGPWSRIAIGENKELFKNVNAKVKSQ
jgi:sphingolipid delta-4 desaturase